MAARIDKVHVEMDVYVEFEGHTGVSFDLPPEEPLAQELLDWHLRRLRAEVLAAAPANIDIG